MLFHILVPLNLLNVVKTSNFFLSSLFDCCLSTKVPKLHALAGTIRPIPEVPASLCVHTVMISLLGSLHTCECCALFCPLLQFVFFPDLLPQRCMFFMFIISCLHCFYYQPLVYLRSLQNLLSFFPNFSMK